MPAAAAHVVEGSAEQPPREDEAVGRGGRDADDPRIHALSDVAAELGRIARLQREEAELVVRHQLRDVRERVEVLLGRTRRAQEQEDEARRSSVRRPGVDPPPQPRDRDHALGDPLEVRVRHGQRVTDRGRVLPLALLDPREDRRLVLGGDRAQLDELADHRPDGLGERARLEGRGRRGPRHRSRSASARGRLTPGSCLVLTTTPSVASPHAAFRGRGVRIAIAPAHTARAEYVAHLPRHASPRCDGSPQFRIRRRRGRRPNRGRDSGSELRTTRRINGRPPAHRTSGAAQGPQRSNKHVQRLEGSRRLARWHGQAHGGARRRG